MADDEPTSILVVDDLPEKLFVYRTILDELGQNLVTAGSGEEALGAVLRQDFAVILLDVNMPGMNGFETAALIRKRKRSSHTPIIFLTAFIDETGVAEGYAQGAVDYMTTPVVPAILRAKVRVFAELYRMAQKVKRQAEERIVLAAERMKREAAEETNLRLGILVRAGSVLGQSLDPDVTARHVVEVSVPELADAAALVLLPLDGRPARCIERGGAEVLEGGLIPNDPALAAAVGAFLAGNSPRPQPGPVVAIPLWARDRTFAVLILSRGPDRIFAAPDLVVAETLVSRAVIALENARLYQEIQRADRQKNEFLAMLAHELRNPLAPIRNATVLLGHSLNDPKRAAWAHQVIDRQLTHLIRLVDDLLDVSRITLGKISLAVEPIELEAVVAQAVEAARPVIDQFRHELVVSLPPERPRVEGDKARLAQVFINLLNNAAKYTEPGGRIRIAVETEGDFATVRVRDSGVGISAELLPAVFELFTQASRSLDRSQGGLGVGLTLVRRLVEMHGGTVEAVSPGAGQGSEFRVRLPRISTEAGIPAVSDALVEVAEAAALRVLVVDDNKDSADSLADLLKFLGHQVRVAYDGPAGIAITGEFDPDLVLLDIGLPGMDGYEVARRLRTANPTRPLLAAVSGYGLDADRQTSRASGIEHHFVKPIAFHDLRELLASVRAAP